MTNNPPESPWLDTEHIERVRAFALKTAKGAEFVVSVSGGKDSTATCLWLQALRIPFVAVHMATGWEHPDTDAYLADYLPGLIGPIDSTEFDGLKDPDLIAIAEDLELRHLGGRPSAMVRMVLQKKMFSSRIRRFCTTELKVKPFQKWARKTMKGRDFVNVTGVRSEESSARSSLPEWDMDDEGYLVWRPLIDWTEGQVIDLHLHRNVKPNPLYTRGAARVGCMPCIFARKAEVRQIFDMSPERLALVSELEEITTKRAMERLEESRAAGRDIDSKFLLADGTPKYRGYFLNPNHKKVLRANVAKALELGHPRTPRDPDGKTIREPGAYYAEDYAKEHTPASVPVAEVHKWSRTNRKGDPEPFAPLPHETGCTRWGFCDLAWTDPNEQPSLFGGDGVDLTRPKK